MRNSLIILSFLFGLTAFGQNTGLYGKKFCIDFSASGAIPVLNMLNGTMYKPKGGQLVAKNDLFDYSLRTGVSYAIANNIALGFEFDVEFMNIAAPEYVTLGYPSGFESSNSVTHEAFNTRTMVFMPRIEISYRNGLLPIGISHQAGVGISRTSIVEKDYDYTIHAQTYNGESPITSTFEEDFYDYDSDPISGMVLMYTLNMRTPINKSMMITYGFRYNFNFVLNTPEYITSDPWGYSEDNTFYKVKRRRMYSVISFNLGLAYAL